ncbi:SM-20-related protein [Marinobacter daqiaonensis]|uniref:SM-20-related protein n=1 Tax=Marinobacter daqiaonensis TaxID=650891 RepID=A0A1I6GXR9_9GAMM|nr:2OG-Fe(II) oxygenase [Marinobacter daqiaonensis]SFR46861.1 SM-20-related protein [Marinobacter daqiaonensis]
MTMPLLNASFPRTGDPAVAQCQAGETWLDTIADDLCQHGWLTLDATPLLGPELLAELHREVEILEKTAAMERAGVGRGGDFTRDRSVRRDRIAWLNGETACQGALFDFFEQVRVGLNRRLFLGLQRFEAHYASYQPGDFYRRHVDSFQGRASRVVSLVMYLNEDWGPADGGELQVFGRNAPGTVCGRVFPERGRMAVFMSEEVPHEVLPAARSRHSIACWFRQDVVPVPLTGV